jgi:hypothetical protein
VIFKRVFTYSDRERLVRLFRVVWHNERAGERDIKSTKLSVGLTVPWRVRFVRELDGWIAVILGVRVHFRCSWSGRFV